MIQIKLLKDWKNKKAGDIMNISKSGGDQFVKEGYAEYVQEEKKVKFKKVKKSSITVDPFILKELKEKYQAVSEYEFDSFISQKIDFYSSMNQETLERYGFDKGIKNEFWDKIKESITFIQGDYKAPKIIEKKEVKSIPEEQQEEEENEKPEVIINEKYIEKDDFFIKSKYVDLTKDKKWGDASELLVKHILSKFRIYSLKNDQKSEMWIYKDGIYVPNGKSEIKEFLRYLLGKWYSSWIFGKVSEKIEADTFIDIDKFFNCEAKNEIPVLNGILNVDTLDIKPYSPDRIFFSKIPVTFDLSKECPKIEKFLKDVLKNEEDIKVFYELAGFGLYKEYFIEKSIMLVGGGRNGKGKTIELLKRLVGADNCCSIPLASLRVDGFSISELFRKLFNLAGDVGNQDLKDTSMFKSLTGRDLVNGKRKFMNDLSFENYSKFVFACNELPMVYDLSKGFWDRWVLLEFPYTFVPEDEFEKQENKENFKIRDPDIINEITTPEEMSGLLNQALIGLRRLKENKNFSSTCGSEEVKDIWIKKSNSFVSFCYNNLEEDYDAVITKKELRKHYSNFCKENKIPTKSDAVIKRVLQDTYGVSEERRDSLIGIWEWVWVGLKWKKGVKNE